MLLGTLGASLLGNILAGKGINRAREGGLRSGYGNKTQDHKKNGFLMPPHPLTDFEIQKYYQNEPRFNGIYSRDNLSRIKDGVALYVQNNDVSYFDSFGIEHIPKEIRTFIGNKNIKTNILRIQAYDSIMCGYFGIGFIDFMLEGKALTEFTNLFSPNNFKRNDDVILKHFITNV